MDTIRDPHSVGVRVFRWVLFLLAAFYVLRQFVFAASYADPGGPFRYLTHWALLLNFVTVSRMLAVTEHRSDRDWGMLVGVAAVINALVVMLYWRLFFQDPALVNTGTPIWWVEYYLHLLGPVLLWIDALFVYGGFRHPGRALAGLVVIVAAYIAWIELFVGPFNDLPSGSVTSGLPYPFLNNMEIGERLAFYGTTCISVLVFLGLFWGMAVLVRRLMGQR